MATLYHGQVGMKKETTYGTGVTVDRFYEILPDSSHDFDPEIIQGVGLRTGDGHRLSARRTPGTGKGDLTVKVEVISKSFGVLLESFAPAIAINNVTGSMYQIRALSTGTTTLSNSYTIQVGVPDMTGTVRPYTYAGCVAKSFEIDAPSRGVPTLSVSFWASSVTTGTALATASYASSPTIFTDQSGKAGVTLGGALTVPTTTALESGGTANTNVRSWTLSGDLGINERPKVGGWQQPTLGRPSTQLKVDQDFDALTTSALVTSQGTTSFTGYFTGAQISSTDERFGVVVPTAQLTPGAFGQLTDGEGSVPSLTFDVQNNGTDAAWYVVARTGDTAL